MCEKINVRKYYKNFRDGLDKSYRENASNLLCKNIIQNIEYQSEDNILLYAAIGSELNLYGLAMDAFSKGKKVFYPKCFGDVMAFYEVKDLLTLSPGAFMVPEPTDLGHKFSDNHGLILVPGLAFSGRRYRVGYGKGYYDKYLSEHNDLISIGVGFHDQFNVDFQESEFDIALDYLYSEQGEES